MTGQDVGQAVKLAVHGWIGGKDSCHTIPEVIESMNSKQQEERQQKKNRETFNSVTQKSTPENQNQGHNARKEGMGPNTKR